MRYNKVRSAKSHAPCEATWTRNAKACVMSVPPCTVVLAPQCRRQLAAVLLRGKLAHYETSPVLAHVIDRCIDDLLMRTAAHTPASSWEEIAEYLVHRYAYRLPASSHPFASPTPDLRARAA